MAEKKPSPKTDALRKQREAAHARRQAEAPEPAPQDVVDAPRTKTGKREVVKK